VLAGLAWEKDTNHGIGLDLRILWRPARDPGPPPPPAVHDDQEEPPF
jgi:hypothetical protein